MAGWADAILVGRPEGKNEEESNQGGLVILLKEGPDGHEEEVARVAFDREEGAHSDMPFNEKCDEAVAVAEETLSQIRKLFERAGELQ